MTKALNAAMMELVEAGRLKQGELPAEDQITVRAQDDQIVVSIEFTTEG